MGGTKNMRQGSPQIFLELEGYEGRICTSDGRNKNRIQNFGRKETRDRREQY